MVGTDPWPVFAISSALCLSSIISWGLRRFQIDFFPESGFFIVLGGLIGGVNKLFIEDPLITIDPQLILFVLLPIIIFEAGFSMNKREFFSNMGTILALAVLGTLVSTLIVGYGLYLFETLGVFQLSNDPLVALLFSSLISAVDPVATLAIFAALKVDRVLYAIVFGESVLNDAVSISLYQTFLSFINKSGMFTVADLFEALGIFLGKFVGAFFVGIIIAGLGSFAMKKMRVKEPTLVIAFISMLGYLVYSLCEGTKLSGIVGILFCGITLKHYAYYNTSDEAKRGIVDFLHGAAYLAEVAIYIYLGMAFFIVEMEWNWPFVFLALLLCLIGRLAHVFPICWISNLRRKHTISLPFQFFIWFSGLRGAIAFALVLLLPDVPHKQMLVSTTLMIVVITTFIIGGSTKTLLGFLNIKTGDFESLEEKILEKQKRKRPSERNSFMGRFRNMDKKVLMPFLTGKALAPESLDESGDIKYEESDDGFIKVDVGVDQNDDDDDEIVASPRKNFKSPLGQSPHFDEANSITAAETGVTETEPLLNESTSLQRYGLEEKK